MFEDTLRESKRVRTDCLMVRGVMVGVMGRPRLIDLSDQ